MYESQQGRPAYAQELSCPPGQLTQAYDCQTLLKHLAEELVFVRMQGKDLSVHEQKAGQHRCGE